MNPSPNPSSPAKFIFETVFDGDDVIAAPRPKRLYTAEEVEQVRTGAYADGERSAVAVAEREQAAALTEIAGAAGSALDALAHVAHDHRTASARLALVAAGKIAGAALDLFPEAPAVAALESLARELEAAPRLVVKVNTEAAERLAAALERAAQSIGYSGQIVVDSDPALQSAAAFGFDWGDGRAAFDPAASAERVSAALETALAAEGLHAEPLPLANREGAPQ